MSFNHDVESKLNIYGGVLRESKYGQDSPGFTESLMRRRLSDQLAANLAHDAIVRTEDRYSTTYRLEVYVLTPAQLEKYVQRRAEQMHPSTPNVEWQT